MGLIIRILPIGFPKLAYFHLLTHALFKALLFICAGVVTHSQVIELIRLRVGIIGESL